MVKSLKFSIGLDVSKDKFDACICVIDSQLHVVVKASSSFENTQTGFKKLIVWIKKHLKEDIPIVFTMEATGVYYEQLSSFLHSQDLYVSVVLPNKAKKYFQSLGIKSKNDKIDAKGLAQMGAEQNLRQWKPFSKVYYKLRSLTRQHEGLHKHRTEIKSKLHNQKFLMHKTDIVNNQNNKMLELIEIQLKEVELEIKKLIDQDEALKSKIKKICKIKGLAILSVATIIAETNGFVLFENQRQLVSYSGYDVIENQSGKHVGKTKISKKGNAHIRRILHMPALTAVRWNEPIFKNLYTRVYKRTNKKMKGYVAVQKKLLILIYTLWKKDMEYDPNYYKKYFRTDEHKSLFAPDFEKVEKKVVPSISIGTTQDELPCNESQEALFFLLQN